MTNEKTTTGPVTTSGWYEHTDGTVGKYTWRDGRLRLDVTVLTWEAVLTPEQEMAALVAGDEASHKETEPSLARYSLVQIDGSGDYYVQETDAGGEFAGLYNSDGERVDGALGNVEWTFLRDLGPVTGDTDDFYAAVETCPEMPTPEVR